MDVELNALNAAQKWHNLGIAPIPIAHKGKRPLVTWSSYQRRLPSRDELRWWFQDKPHNLALVCGWRGLTVIDFDDMNVYLLWRSWAADQGGIAADVAELTYQVLTSRGVHVYVALEQMPSGNRKLDLIDVKTQGGYVLAPPSVHPSGHRYTAIEEGAPVIRAQSLEQLLPAELLRPAEPEPDASETPGVTTTVVQSEAQLVDDPWQAAVQPVMLEEGSIVKRILRRLSIIDLFPQASRHPQHSRRYLWACCPLHNDSDPSLSIDPRKGKAKCWAGCTGGRWWDALDWHAALNNLSLQEAIQQLAYA